MTRRSIILGKGAFSHRGTPIPDLLQCAPLPPLRLQVGWPDFKTGAMKPVISFGLQSLVSGITVTPFVSVGKENIGELCFTGCRQHSPRISTPQRPRGTAIGLFRPQRSQNTAAAIPNFATNGPQKFSASWGMNRSPKISFVPLEIGVVIHADMTGCIQFPSNGNSDSPSTPF